jgi:hypothetical protein
LIVLNDLGHSGFNAIPLFVIPAKAGTQIRDHPVDCAFLLGFPPCFPVRPPLSWGDAAQTPGYDESAPLTRNRSADRQTVAKGFRRSKRETGGATACLDRRPPHG